MQRIRDTSGVAGVLRLWYPLTISILRKQNENVWFTFGSDWPARIIQPNRGLSTSFYA